MRIFDRPDLDQVSGRLAMFIDGQLPVAKPGDAYQGRLKLHNPIGGVSVAIIDGDPLPNGAGIAYDAAAGEIVLSWPAYLETAAVIPNPGFEDGDTMWQKGPGWVIGSENPPVGAKAARYLDAYGSSLIENVARYPTIPGRAISATCAVRQGASSEGNAGAAVQLQWRRSTGELVATSEGNAVMSASKNRVYPSTVAAVPPEPGLFVNVAARGIRHRENKALFVDEFTWTHQLVSGIDQEATFNLTIQAKDSAGRSAIWRGQVKVMYGDDYYASVVLLLHFDPVYVRPDGTFINSAPLPHSNLVIQPGGCQIVPGRFVDGVANPDPGAGVYYVSSPVFAVGTGDFTAECFVRCSAAPAGLGSIISFYQDARRTWKLAADSAGRLVLVDFNAPLVSSVATIADGQWHHVAVSRVAGVGRIFVDGLMSGQVAMPQSYDYSGTPFTIGCDKINGVLVPGTQLVGTFDEVRFTKGVGRYTADFTPPHVAFPNRAPG
ncbi:LamG domain-containing protein [Stenotrophomonas geniculata]|uniref:LamG domain-containing protein n=1 Tax=Stenotrophomonas geniculata TaxID=86188 RepID=UPI0039C6776F